MISSFVAPGHLEGQDLSIGMQFLAQPNTPFEMPFPRVLQQQKAARNYYQAKAATQRKNAEINMQLKIAIMLS